MTDTPEDRAKAALQRLAADTACPHCGHHGMEMTFRMVAKPLGSFSLAGSQLKFSANEIPYIECPECGIGGEGNVVHE